MTIEQFARQPQGADRVIRGIAASRVGQISVFGRRQRIQQTRLTGVLANVGAADGDGDDFRARGFDRKARLFEILVLAGPDQKTGGIGFSSDNEWFHKFFEAKTY